jgi:hypothetical protein
LFLPICDWHTLTLHTLTLIGTYPYLPKRQIQEATNCKKDYQFYLNIPKVIKDSANANANANATANVDTKEQVRLDTIKLCSGVTRIAIFKTGTNNEPPIRIQPPIRIHEVSLT